MLRTLNSPTIASPVPLAYDDATKGFFLGGVPAGESIGTKLRRLAGTALISNPFINQPLLAVSAWVANTAYTAGQVVSNGGNNYLCYTAGTSAGSGGPTGTGAAGITDNTVVWFFFGLTATASSSAIAPTLTIATSNPGGLTNSYVVATNDASFFYSGGTPTAAGGGYRFPASTITPGGTGNAVGNQNNNGYKVSFITDAPKFAIVNTGTTNWRVIVDNQYVTISANSNPDGNKDYAVVDFTSTGGRKARRVDFESYGAQTFNGVNVDTASQVWQPPQNDALQALMVGDSFLTGGNAFPVISNSSWAATLGQLLGWSDAWNVGLGGIGCLPNNSANLNSYGQRITDVTKNNPAVIVIQGSGHDTSPTFNATQVTFTVRNYLQNLRNALPAAIIFVTGLFPFGGLTTAMAACENAYFAAVTQMSDPLMFAIPFCTLATSLQPFTGSGNVGSTTGSGNGDVYISNDASHPTQSGTQYQAYRIANYIRALLPQIP